MVIVGQGKRTHAQTFSRRNDAWGVPKISIRARILPESPKIETTRSLEEAALFRPLHVK